MTLPVIKAPELRDRRPAINWTVVLVAALAAIPPSLAALATYIKTNETHDLVNSRMTEMLTVVRQGSADAATLAEKKKQEERKLIEGAASATPAPVVPVPAPAKH